MSILRGCARVVRAGERAGVPTNEPKKDVLASALTSTPKKDAPTNAPGISLSQDAPQAAPPTVHTDALTSTVPTDKSMDQGIIEVVLAITACPTSRSMRPRYSSAMAGTASNAACLPRKNCVEPNTNAHPSWGTSYRCRRAAD